MKAGILLAIIAGLAATLWFGGVLQPAARDILISQATATPSLNGEVAVVLTIENQGEPDRILSVESVAGPAHFQDAQDGLPVRTGTSSLAQDAAFVRLTPTDAVIEDGALLPITLMFESAGPVSIKARFNPPEPGDADVMGHGSLNHVVASGPYPSISLTAEETNDGWLARITTENFTFSEAEQDGDHIPGHGHGHIYVSGMKLGRIFSDTFTIGALPAGEHILRVTLNTNNHLSYVVNDQPLMAETVITVD